ncbi:MAG TPA: hypothetical protein VK560_01170 [Gemmatimonadaceae bacterium]|nr:hypothetical protein [Gemmatimonadaceae bacterium]
MQIPERGFAFEVGRADRRPARDRVRYDDIEALTLFAQPGVREVRQQGGFDNRRHTPRNEHV